MEREYRKVVTQRGKPEFWDGDEMHLSGIRTLCVRWRCWDGDGRRTGGQMTSCGS